MSSSIQNLDHLKIPLDNILKATNHFSNENFIRQGGFGKIYKGTLKRSRELVNTVARRLDTKYGQGSKQFWTEILMLSKLEHQNLVSLVGFCDEKNVQIVVNKYEAKGSLDNYLSDPTLTWGKRLHICVGIAHALSYIHYDKKRDFSIIHRNIKSSKILLDRDWLPKLSGFELSMTTVASQRDRVCIDDACGTIGYVDPVYVKTGSVTCKSDIYSFGVVLFEVLLGKKAINDNRDTKLAQLAQSHYEKGNLDDLINPDLRKQMNVESLKIFSETAYDCLKEHRAGRPSILQVVMKLVKALHLQLSPGPSLKKITFKGTSSDQKESLEEINCLQVSLADIKLATRDFNDNNVIGEGGFGKVYTGKLRRTHEHKLVAAKRLNIKSDQGETELMTELVILSEYKHTNVIDLVSYCNENGEKVIVYEYAARGSLDKWLKHKELTWRKRLGICIDIAMGLNFLHGTNDVKKEVVIHRDIKSANILLHDDWKASIADFGLSLISPINQDINYVIDNAKGTPGYCDPLYITTKTLTKESDIYSLGVLLFEMLCGRFVMEDKNSKAQNLVQLVRHHYYEKGSIYKIVFDAIKKQIAPGSLTIFQNIAYQCIHEERSKRPTTYDVLKQLKKALEPQEIWDHLLNISLDDIMLATKDFSQDNLIEKGDFWSVYKGHVTWADGGEMIIAAKRLDRRSDQRETESIKDLYILLDCKHESIISLVGYCDEKGEKILVYEYASISKGSLDRWLKYDGLTWRKRLEICLDIARALVFLHKSSGAKQYVVIHGDIKSSNVLLHGDWKAKIAYFGCSSISPVNHKMKYVVNNTTGTPGYCDRLSTTARVLTKESDIYSFGVLLFEILCGRSVMEHNSSRSQNLVDLVRHHFKEGSLYEMVFEATKKQMAPKSFTTFKNIAYHCIVEERARRPTADDVLNQLQIALKSQVDFQVWEPYLPRDYKKIIQMAVSRDINLETSYEYIYASLVRGILLQNSTLWFSIGVNGERVERRSTVEFKFGDYFHGPDRRLDGEFISRSRFGNISKILDSSSLNIQIKLKPQLLSLGVNYGVYLLYMFKNFRESSNECKELTYKIGNKYSRSHYTKDTDDGWSMIQLYQFPNLKDGADINIFVKGFPESHCKNEAIFLEGVEFQAINNITQEEIKKLEKVNMGGHIMQFLLCSGKCATQRV